MNTKDIKLKDELQRPLQVDVGAWIGLDALDGASEEFLSKIDKDRFLIEPAYSKTIFACLSNDLAYTPEHQTKIAAIDSFLTNKGIIDVIVALGNYDEVDYCYVKESNEWIYCIPAPDKGLFGLVDDKSIQVKSIKDVFKESALNDD